MFGLHLVHGMFSDLFDYNEWEFLLGFIASSIDSKTQLPK